MFAASLVIIFNFSTRKWIRKTPRDIAIPNKWFALGCHETIQSKYVKSQETKSIFIFEEDVLMSINRTNNSINGYDIKFQTCIVIINDMGCGKITLDWI